MKTLLLILFSPVIGFAQETINNFYAENNELIWVKVFSDSSSFQSLVERVKDSGSMATINVTGDKITGDIKDIDADFKGAGYSEMATPMYIARSFYTGFIVIEYKESRYRVTFKKIVLTQKYSDPLTKQGEKSTLELWGLKKGKNEMTSAFKKAPSIILNYTFSQKFEFRIPKGKDW